jgi:glyoxylase-like metal-dependent hydrolase (beta-lactamase superfamily II)
VIRLESYGDVLRIRMATARSRLVGYEVSAYVIRGALVDCGFPAAGRELAALLDARPVRGVAVTHYHEDHAGNVALLSRRGLPVLAAAETLALARTRAYVHLYRRFTWGRMPPLTGVPAPFAPDDLALVPTPGHSPDHHVVWDAAGETLFGGDLFLGLRVRNARPGEDPYALARSLRAAAALRPRRLFDAHRGLVDRPADSLRAKAAWVEETVGAVERMLDAGHDDGAIVREVLGGEDLVARFSEGDFTRRNFVRAVRARRAATRSGV